MNKIKNNLSIYEKELFQLIDTTTHLLPELISIITSYSKKSFPNDFKGKIINTSESWPGIHQNFNYLNGATTDGKYLCVIETTKRIHIFDRDCK